jgi:hypothetical protein
MEYSRARLSDAAADGCASPSYASNCSVGAASKVISDCHPREGISKNRNQIPIIHRFYLFSAPPSLG